MTSKNREWKLLVKKQSPNKEKQLIKINLQYKSIYKVKKQAKLNDPCLGIHIYKNYFQKKRNDQHSPQCRNYLWRDKNMIKGASVVLLFPFLPGVTGTGYSFRYTFKIHNNTLECIMYFSQNIILIKRYCTYEITTRKYVQDSIR